MIVLTEDLPQLSGKVTMADGGFDPLHPGHVAYLEACASLGLPVLCNVASDDWVGRKHRPLLAQDARMRILDALRAVTYVHGSHATTADVLRHLRPRYYAKGSDWSGRLPAQELAVCAQVGTEVVFLDTVTDSSTAILRRWAG